MRAVRKPAASIARSTASVSRASPNSPSIDGPPACPGKGQGQDLVPALQGGQDELPGAPGVHEAVQANQRRPRATAVGWGEGRVQAPEASGGPRPRQAENSPPGF